MEQGDRVAHADAAGGTPVAAPLVAPPSDCAALIRAADFQVAGLGGYAVWPEPLRSAIRMMLASRLPTFLGWGQDLTLFYNDAAAALIGARHPAPLGRSLAEGWPDLHGLVRPMLDGILAGQTRLSENVPIPVVRGRRTDHIFLTISYSPIRDDDDHVLGAIATAVDTSVAMHASRRAAFRSALDDVLRDLDDPLAMIAAAAEHLGRHLTVARCGYGEIDEAAGVVLVERDWTDGTMPSAVGQYRLDAFDQANLASVCDNVAVRMAYRRFGPGEDPLPADGAMGQRASLTVPLFKQGRLAAALFVHHPEPRDWNDEDEALIREVAERTWDAVERARAERARRDSEDLLRIAQEAGGIGAFEWYPDSGRLVASAQYRRIWGLPEDGEVTADQLVGLLDPEDRVLSGPARLTGGGNPLAYAEYRIRRPDTGEERWIARRGEIMTDASGPPRYVGVVFDVTKKHDGMRALEESEARFRNVADHAPVMMWVTDPDGRCTYLNRLWYDFTGQTEDEARGFGWLDATHPDDRPMAEAAFVSANAAHGPFRVEYRLRHRDGSYRWAIDAAAPRFGAGGAFLGFVGSVIDIHERREAEARLALSEESLRLATEAAEVGTWDLDIPTDVLTWSTRTRAAFGIDPYSPCTMADFEACLHPDDVAATMVAFGTALDPDQRRTYDVEYRTIGRNDDVLRWVAAKGRGFFDDQGRCVRAIGTAIDITERKRMEDRLRAREVELSVLNRTLEQQVAARTRERNLLATIFETTDAFILILDFDYRILGINRACAAEMASLFKIRAKVGDDLLALLADQPENQAAVRARWTPALAGKEFTVVQEFLDPASTERCYEIRFNVLRDDAGQRIGAYQFAHDVTERLRDQARLAEAQEALRQSQKLEAMGQLTGGVAHDFNNLLTPIIGSLDLLQRRAGLDDRMRRLVDGGLQSAERAKTLVQRLLAFARRQPLQPQSVDIVALVAGMADLVGSTLGPQVVLTVDVPDGSLSARADPNQLEMAILNLAVNARDAMPVGGALRISAGAETIAGTHPAGLSPGDYVRIAVADDGAGMDEGTRARAIEPFFSTKGIGKGTGLGLSMVHGLTSQLGGALTIDSRPDAGTTVELWLPAGTEPFATPAGTPETASVQRSRGQVLLVDDEDLVRSTTADMLIDLGYAVVEASSATDALRLIERGVAADILVTDHLMPGMTGVELIHQARQARPDLSVLLVSGYTGDEGLASDLPRLTKPFRQADLGGWLTRLTTGG